MKTTITELEGDGIGPELMKEADKSLDAVAKVYDHQFIRTRHPFGAKAYFDYGHPFPDKTKEACLSADVVLKGPIGLAVKDMEKIPAEFGPENAALLPLRKLLDTYVNLRPIFLPESCIDISPLRPERLKGGLDILMMRELVGGIYFGKKVEGKETNMQYAMDECLYTREQVERFAHAVFKQAEKRNKDVIKIESRPKYDVTNVHKKNVLATSRFWNAIFEEVSKQYQSVTMQSRLIDDLAFQLIVNPTQFNGVVALENMQGDILTDEGGGILGSLGLMPSACLNPETGKGYFEPAHGSAPDIAGKGIANPYSMIGSVAFMLEHLGLEKESKAVWGGLHDVLAKGHRTKELASKTTPEDKIISTAQFGDLVAQYVLNSK